MSAGVQDQSSPPPAGDKHQPTVGHAGRTSPPEKPAAIGAPPEPYGPSLVDHPVTAFSACFMVVSAS